MTIRLFRDLELFQPLATVYHITVLALIFSLPNLSINVLPCLFVDVLGDIPAFELVFKLPFSSKRLEIFNKASLVYKRYMQPLSSQQGHQIFERRAFGQIFMSDHVLVFQPVPLTRV